MTRSLSQVARKKMLGSAAELLLDVGVSGFSVDEVARRSGVAKTTIYRHFPSGGRLLVAALDQAMVPPPIPDTGSLHGDLVEYLASVRPMFADRTLRALFFEIYAASLRDSEVGELQQELMRARSGPTLAIFEHARDRGELPDEVDYATMLEAVQSPFVLRAMFRPETLVGVDLGALADRMVAALRS